MKTLLLKLLNMVIGKLIDVDLFNEIKDIVAIYLDADLSGEEKKAAVEKELSELKGALKEAFSSTSKTFLNLAIEAAVAIVKAKFGK